MTPSRSAEVGLRAADDTQVAAAARAEGRRSSPRTSRLRRRARLVLVFVLKKNLPAGGWQAAALAGILHRCEALIPIHISVTIGRQWTDRFFEGDSAGRAGARGAGLEPTSDQTELRISVLLMQAWPVSGCPGPDRRARAHARSPAPDRIPRSNSSMSSPSRISE